MLLRQIFDPGLSQYAYLIACQQTGEALLVDPLRDVDRYLEQIEEEGLRLVAVAETHIHADFLSGARELASRGGVRLYLSAEGGAEWSYGWAAEENGGSVAEAVLLRDGEVFRIGAVELRAIHTPGHTPEHLCYLVTDRGGGATTPLGLLTGDFVLVGDLGRPDLLETAAGQTGTREESARQLYRSLARLHDLEDHLQLWPAHGAGSPCGKAIGAIPTSTLGYERRYNRAIARAADGEDAFVAAILEEQPTPPLYFGRMKRENRDGPELLRRLPRPRPLAADDLGAVAQHGETVVIDTRGDREQFMRAHLPDALYAPAGRAFSTAVGAMLTEPTRAIVLVVEEDEQDECIRRLVRMGYDRVVGYCTPAALHDYFEAGGEPASIRRVTFAEVPELLERGAAVVDVRDYFEFDRGHIPDAVNAPYPRLPEFLSGIPAHQPLAVHCETGARSAVASAWLASRGRSVLYVDDDWSAWRGKVSSGGSRETPPGHRDW